MSSEVPKTKEERNIEAIVEICRHAFAQGVKHGYGYGRAGITPELADALAVTLFETQLAREIKKNLMGQVRPN